MTHSNGAVYEDLTFFHPDLTLLHAAPAEVSADEKLAERRQVARALLTPSGGRPPPRALLGAAFSAERRLERARWLLFEALACDERGKASAAEEAWGYVQQEWKWVATASAAKKALSRLSHGSEKTVADVLSRVSTELLPVLHLRAFIVGSAASRAVARCHIQFLETWAPIDLPTGLAKLYALLPPALAPARRAPSAAMFTAFGELVERKLLPPDAASELVDDLVQIGVDHVITWVRQTTQAATADRWIRWFTGIAGAAEPNLGLLRILSGLYTLVALKKATSWRSLNSACGDLGRALLYDPLNSMARQHLREIDKLFQERAAAMERMGLHPEPVAVQVSRVAESVEGENLRDLRAQALRRELVLRLGFSPSSEEDRWLVDALLSVLEQQREELPRGEDGKPVINEEILSRLRANGELLSPRLRWLPWEIIGRALTQLEDAPLACLALLLPIRARRTLANRGGELVAGAKARVEREAVSGSPGRRSAMLTLTWLGSGRDLVAKVAGLAGLVFALHAGVAMAYSSWDRDRRERMYQAVLNGVSAKDDPATIAQAASFLELAHSDERDPRVGQVAAFYAEAVVREILSASRSGRTDDASRLLASYQQLSTKLPPLDEATRRASGDRQ